MLTLRYVWLAFVVVNTVFILWSHGGHKVPGLKKWSLVGRLSFALLGPVWTLFGVGMYIGLLARDHIQTATLLETQHCPTCHACYAHKLASPDAQEAGGAE